MGRSSETPPSPSRRRQKESLQGGGEGWRDGRTRVVEGHQNGEHAAAGGLEILHN